MQRWLREIGHGPEADLAVLAGRSDPPTVGGESDRSDSALVTEEDIWVLARNRTDAHRTIHASCGNQRFRWIQSNDAKPAPVRPQRHRRATIERKSDQNPRLVGELVGISRDPNSKQSVPAELELGNRPFQNLARVVTKMTSSQNCPSLTSPITSSLDSFSGLSCARSAPLPLD